MKWASADDAQRHRALVTQALTAFLDDVAGAPSATRDRPVAQGGELT